MALTFSEIEELIESGEALPALDEFIKFALALFIGIRTGQIEELPGTRETIIAAVILQKLADTKDGRKLLGVKASNKIYNEKEYGLESAQLEVARRMGCGEITRQQAFDELEDIYHKADTYPSRGTLNRILDDLEKEACHLRENLEGMLKLANWDGSDASLSKILLDIRKVK